MERPWEEDQDSIEERCSLRTFTDSGMEGEEWKMVKSSA